MRFWLSAFLVLAFAVAAEGVPKRYVESEGPRHSEDFAAQVAAKFEEMQKALAEEGCVEFGRAILPAPDGGLLLIVQCREWRQEQKTAPASSN